MSEVKQEAPKALNVGLGSTLEIKSPNQEVLKSVPRLEDLFILHFRQGKNPFPMSKIFEHKGTIRQAMDRARSHCELINARFLRVDPFLNNLTEDELKYRDGGQEPE